MAKCHLHVLLVSGNPKIKQSPLVSSSVVLKMDPSLPSRQWPLTQSSHLSMSKSGPCSASPLLDLSFVSFRRGYVSFNLTASTVPKAITGTTQPSNRRSLLAHRTSRNRRGFFNDFFNCQSHIHDPTAVVLIYGSQLPASTKARR